MRRTRGMRRTFERPAISALVVGLAVLGVNACSPTPEEPKVATAVRPTVSGAGDGAAPVPRPKETEDLTTPISTKEWSRRYDKCMAARGYEFPDLSKMSQDQAAEANRNFKAGIARTAKFMKAHKECEKSLPPIEPEVYPPLTQEQLAKERRYAKCMRDQGVTGYPDPQPGPNTADPKAPQPPYGATKPQWERAFNKCYIIHDPNFKPGQGRG